MEMRMEIKEEEEYVGYVLCTCMYLEMEKREREKWRCAVKSLTAVHRMYYSGQVGRYNDGNNDGMASTYLR